MATPDGPTAPALNEMTRTLREYSLYQAVLQVVEHLRAAHPGLDDDALYDQLEFCANPGLGFPGHEIDRVEFFTEHGQQRARLRLNVLGLFGAGSPLPAFYGEQACTEQTGGMRRGIFSTCFSIACNVCCCRSGASIAIRRGFAAAPTMPFPNRCSPWWGWAGK